MSDREITSVLRTITAYPDVLSLQDKQRLFKSLLLDQNLSDIFSDLSPLLAEKLLVTVDGYLDSIQKQTDFAVGDDLIESHENSRNHYRTHFDKQGFTRKKGKLIFIENKRLSTGYNYSAPMVERKYYVACIGDNWNLAVKHHHWVHSSDLDLPEVIRTSLYDNKIIWSWEDSFRCSWYKV